MLGLLVRSVFEAGQDIFRGSVLSEIIQHWIGSNFLTLVSVLLGGVVFFVIVSFRRRGQRGISSTFTVDFNNADVSLEQVLQTPFRLTVKRSRQDPTKKKRKEKERVQPNGHPATTPDGGIADREATPSPARPDGKPLKPKKKKRKTDDNLEKSIVLLSNDLFSTRDRSEEEETGVWERKMSSREKRQMRKERMKRKENPRVGSQHRPPMAEIRWNTQPHAEGEWQPRPATGEPRGPEARPTGGPRREARPPDAGKVEKTSRRAVEWAPPSRLEEDIFSHVGTWDSKDLKTEPVTFGTVPDLTSAFGNGLSQPGASREEWSGQIPPLGMEDAWLRLEDSSEVDQTSDWKPPKEEWGNWAGEEGTLGQETGQQHL
ncbi:protein LYRIC-like [Conger conger]|uniref:protein LYRIC-like n=1 Tax=Conger conger TaxID=82655 RepID=UPI002A5A9512|nr:protein LYRIC-like [Conger conger]